MYAIRSYYEGRLATASFPGQRLRFIVKAGRFLSWEWGFWKDRGQGVRVITSYSIHYTKLYDCIFAELIKGRIFLFIAPEDILQGCCHKKILLPQTQFLALTDIVWRIQDLGKSFGLHLPLHRADIVTFIEIRQIKIPGSLRITSYNVCYTKLLRNHMIDIIDLIVSIITLLQHTIASHKVGIEQFD